MYKSVTRCALLSHRPETDLPTHTQSTAFRPIPGVPHDFEMTQAAHE